MKNYWIVFLAISLLFVPDLIRTQVSSIPFFDNKGAIRIQTTEMDALADTIAVVYHRADDVVWSRIVYRVIDMREKQNFQLYFPVRGNAENRSLFRVMLDAICAGDTVYKRNPRELKPSFNEKLIGEELSNAFAYDTVRDNNIIQIDPVSKTPFIGETQYIPYVRNQMKFLLQEIIFFDKHTSRMYTKAIAIAPLYAFHPDNTKSKKSMQYFNESIICWFSFDELRPYLARQYVIPNGNETHRLTFDEFFSQRLFSSYLLGDGNMYNRMLLENYFEASKIRKEQTRIETEIMNIELDLWEY